MTPWPEVTLAQVSQKPQYGAIASADNKPVGPRFVRQTDIITGRVDWSGVPYAVLSPSDEEKYRLSPGDLLISRLGAGVGNAARMDDTPGAVFAGYLVRFKVLPSRADSRYVGYVLQSGPWRKHVQAVRSGGAQPTLNAKQMGAFRFALPPLEEQERIAGVLGAFDDLIETNRRLIERLDQAATVRAGQLAEDANGELRKFADVAEIGGGGTPSTRVDAYWGGAHPWATPKDITALPSQYLFDTPRKLTDAGLAKCSSPLRPVGSILMTSRATVGEFALAEVPVAVNQGFIVVNGETPADTTWLFFEMRRRTPEFKTIAAKGSTFPEISRREFKSLDVRWPEASLRHQLHLEVGPLLAGAAELEREVASLTRQRDELLPLLMSGRVRVRDMAGATS